ncbi:hypothetical protein ACFL4G_04045 [Thermodesulfobacteriota bacterium]
MMKRLAIALPLVMILLSPGGPFPSPAGSEQEFYSDSLDVELFILSRCPYGAKMIGTIEEIKRFFGNTIEFRLHYVAELSREAEPPAEQTADSGLLIQDQILQSLTGPSYEADFCESGALEETDIQGRFDLDENIRQATMAEYYPDQFFDYFFCRAADEGEFRWEPCALASSIDPELILLGIESGHGEELYYANINRSRAFNITRSPTLMIAGEVYTGRVDFTSIARKICSRMTDSPATLEAGFSVKPCDLIPVCRYDSDCVVGDGFIGTCVDADTLNARCEFSKPIPCRAKVLSSDRCTVCSVDRGLEHLHRIFPGIEAEIIPEDSEEGRRLIAAYGIELLPAYIFDQSVSGTKKFATMRYQFTAHDDVYILDPLTTGGIFYINRDRSPKRVDLFVMSMSPLSITTLTEFLDAELREEMDLKIHYIVKRARMETVDGKVFRKKRTTSTTTLTSPFGLEDIHEGIRRKCVADIHPGRTLDFERCRNAQFVSGHYEDEWRVCAAKLGLDVAGLTDCITGGQGPALLDKEIDWIEEIGGSVNPSYLINNQVLLRGIKPKTALKIYQVMNP